MSRARDLANFVSNADGDVKFDTDTLFIDSSANNVGIRNNSPDTPLHVDCGAPSSADKTIAKFQSQSSRQIGFVWDDSASTMGIATLTNHPIAFHINGNSSEKMRLTSNGLTFNGDTAADNALDDYEEGLHSPTLVGDTSGSVSMRSGYQNFAYTVVGNRCTMTGRWEVQGGHSLSGNVSISLPFATAQLTDQAGVGVGTIILHRTGTDFDQGVVFGLVAFEAQSKAYIYYQPSGTGNEALVQGSQLDSNFEGYLNISFAIS